MGSRQSTVRSALGVRYVHAGPQTVCIRKYLLIAIDYAPRYYLLYSFYIRILNNNITLLHYPYRYEANPLRVFDNIITLKSDHIIISHTRYLDEILRESHEYQNFSY